VNKKLCVTFLLKKEGDEQGHVVLERIVFEAGLGDIKSQLYNNKVFICTH